MGEVITPLPGKTGDQGGRVAASGGDGGGATSIGLRCSSTPALTRLSGAPPATISELDNAPPPGLSPGPGRPRQLLAPVRRGGADKADARSGPGDDAPAYGAPPPVTARHRGGGKRGEGGCCGGYGGAPRSGIHWSSCVGVGRLRQLQRDIVAAESAEREAAAAAMEAHHALVYIGAAVSGSTAPRSPSTRQQGVASRSKRPGDEAFLNGSVAFMASSPRVDFSTEFETKVVATASALLASVILLASVRKTSLHLAELLSVQKAWSSMNHST